MLGALTVLLVSQLTGEVPVQFAGLPSPGPVIDFPRRLMLW